MGLERDVLRASALLHDCSLKPGHVLCRLAWSNRLHIPRDADERSASQQNMDDADALLQVHCDMIVSLRTAARAKLAPAALVFARLNRLRPFVFLFEPPPRRR
jgi:hypothetical protein